MFDKEENYKIVRFSNTNSDETILAIGKVGSDMWISTQSNVWKIDGETLRPTLLPIPQKSYTAVYEDTISNKVYLGATDELVVVNNDISGKTGDYKTIKMILSDHGEGGLHLADINESTKEISIPYGGNVRLVVSSLEYSPETVQRYMYKLAESPTDTIDHWIIMPEGVNSITLSELKMGNYYVLIKPIDSPTSPVAIPLIVRPHWRYPGGLYYYIS